MISLRRLPIAKKIVAITVITSTAALVLASAALVAYDYAAVRRELKSSTAILAQIVADQLTAAVSFGDRAAALETLNALHAEPSIVTACVYSGARLFAEHSEVRPTAACPITMPDSFSDRDLQIISAPIEVKGKTIGTVVLQATLSPAYARLRLEIVAIVAVLLFSAAFAFGLAARLQKVVSAPILSLAQTANAVSSNRDYSIQAPKQTEDELGKLVDSFNEMMRQIERRDVDLRARTTELEQANEELLKAAKMKDEFLATLSHELRTPLTAVLGWVALLRSGGDSSGGGKAARAAEVIERNARAQLQLVDDLLNVSQIVTGKLKIRPEWTRAGTIVRSAVDSIQPAAVAKGIRLVAEVADPDEPVFADPERIQQVLWNLLTNAIKFSSPDGEIKIQCGRIGNIFEMAVTDGGDGIESEFIPHLFERFTQADSSRRRKHGGLGLGLAIVRHIVESHGGAVVAYSDGRGHGAAFTVRLPIPALQQDPKSASSEAESSRL